MIKTKKFKFRRTVDSYIDLLADSFTQNLKIELNNPLYKRIRKELALDIKNCLMQKYKQLNPNQTIKRKQK